MSCSVYLASNRKFPNFGAIHCHGTVFAPMQCLYCKEATGVESPKMQFPRQCKNRTDRYGSTNYPMSCSAVSCQKCKFSEFWGYFLPWYRVCTNAKLILNGSNGVESPKMQFPSQYKNRTDRYGCSAVSPQQSKFSEFWGYFLPWYHVCTNAKFIL